MKRFLPALMAVFVLLGLGACRAAPAPRPAPPTVATAARPADAAVAVVAGPTLAVPATVAPSATATRPMVTTMPTRAAATATPTGTTPAPSATPPPTPTATSTPVAPTATDTPPAPTATRTPPAPTATYTPVASSPASRVDAGLLPPGTAGQIDALFAEWDRAGSPGCSLGLGQAGQLIYGRGYGLADLQHGVPITAGTVFNTGSLAKQVTALAVELLREDGRLGLDDDLRRYVPELPAYAANITLRQMLAHTSGLRDDRTLSLMAGRGDDELLTAGYLQGLIFRQQDTNFPPGQEFSYSNSNFSLLALIVSRVDGRPFEQFAGERLFAPLGMASTSFAANPQALVPGRALAYAPAGAGYQLSLPNAALPGPTNLYTTVGDLLQWADNYSRARVGTRPGLDAALQPARNNQGGKVAYNFGLEQRTYRGLGPTLSHDGIDGGFRAALLFWSESRRAAAVLCNVEGSDAETLAVQAARLWLGVPAAPPTPRPTPRPTVPAETYVTLPPEALAGRAGIYYEPDTTRLLRLYAEGDQLRIEGLPDLALVALEPGHFRVFSAGSPTPGEARFAGDGPDLTIENTLLFNGSYRRYPDPAAGPDNTGTYYSPELDTTYRISVQRGVLTLDSRRFVEIPLLPLGEGRFEMAGAVPPITVAFTAADGAPRSAGFALSLDRARHVRFDRAP